MPVEDPTYQDFVKHIKRFGLEGKYTTYAKAENDSVLEVAKRYLSRDEYIRLVKMTISQKVADQVADREGWNDDDESD